MDRKFKIINVHFQFSPYGGGELIAYNNYKILKNKGHEVYCFGINIKPYFEGGPDFSKYFVKQNKKTNFIDYIKNIPSAFYNLKYKQQFEQMLDEVKPDIVHVHTLGTLTMSILKPCFDRHIPVIKTEHSANIACPSESLFFKNKTYCNNHLCVKGNYLHCVLNKCYQNNLYKSLATSLRNFFNDCLGYNNKISLFVSPSNALKEIIKEKGIPDNKIVVVENFFDTKFKNQQNNSKLGHYFLFSGRLYNFKGIKTLIEAINSLPREIPFHIAGTGPMEKELKEYSRKHSLNNVRFLGFLSQDELAKEYQNCIATITPSIWFENFPTTTLESFIMSKPVIGANIGGIPEQVEHNKTGLLFEPANVEQLKECIMKYWNNPNLVVEHGKNAYEKAKTQYTEERYYNELMQVYNEVLERNKLQ